MVMRKCDWCEKELDEENDPRKFNSYYVSATGETVCDECFEPLATGEEEKSSPDFFKSDE